MKATVGDLIHYNGDGGEPPCYGIVSSIKDKYMAIITWPFPDGDGEVTSEIDIKEVYTGQNIFLTVLKKEG
jgi:hypothetical protein